jgi:hypothetical protein
MVRDGALGGIGADVMARSVAAILPGVTVTPLAASPTRTGRSRCQRR